MKRTVILGGSMISIDSLGHPLDQAFDKLFAAYFGKSPVLWEEFTTAATHYFNSTIGNWAAHDVYFNAFTIIWQNLLGGGRYADAEQLWDRALQPALEWERSNVGQRLHKGTPYYFWGMTAILRGEMDHGYLLVHQGVDEDVKSNPAGWQDAPGYALVTLNDEKQEQAFRAWVIGQARFLNDRVAAYNTIHGRALTIEDVKRRFFQAPPDTQTVFLLTYTLARFIQLDKLPPHTTENIFAGQLELNLLFDLTRVIDAAIKAKTGRGSFIDHAESLLNSAGAVLTNGQLRDINTQFNNNFDGTVQAALDVTLTLGPNLVLNRLQCDVALAYGLRNHGAHNTGTAPTIWRRFPEVRQTVFRVLLATVEYLY